MLVASQDVRKHQSAICVWVEIPNSGNEAVASPLIVASPICRSTGTRTHTIPCLRVHVHDMVDHDADDPQTSDSKQQFLHHLRSICTDECSRVSVVHQVMMFPLSPSRCGQELETVREMIHQKEFTYVPE